MRDVVELLVIHQIFQPVIQWAADEFLEVCTYCRSIIGTLELQNFFQISDVLLRFETRAFEKRLG